MDGLGVGGKFSYGSLGTKKRCAAYQKLPSRNQIVGESKKLATNPVVIETVGVITKL